MEISANGRNASLFTNRVFTPRTWIVFIGEDPWDISLGAHWNLRFLYRHGSD